MLVNSPFLEMPTTLASNTLAAPGLVVSAMISEELAKSRNMTKAEIIVSSGFSGGF